MRRILSMLLVGLTLLGASGCQSEDIFLREDIISVEIENFGATYNFQEEINIKVISSQIDLVKIRGANWNYINYPYPDALEVESIEGIAHLSRLFQNTAPVSGLELVYALVLKANNSAQVSSHIKVRVGGRIVAREEIVVNRRNQDLAFYLKVDASGRYYIEQLFK